jgi:MraZ protein
MEPDDAVARTYYNSVYRHGVDDKRRIQFPAKWRPAKEGTELTIMLSLKSSEGPCLRVLLPEKMAELMRDLNAMPNSDPNKTTLKRFIGSQSEQVTLDKSGRICLPESMARDAGIKINEEVVLVGLLDRVEIWNAERFAKVAAADAVMAQEAFKLLE